MMRLEHWHEVYNPTMFSKDSGIIEYLQSNNFCDE